MRRGGHGPASEVEGMALDRRLLGRLLRYLRPYRTWVGISVLLMLLGSIVQLAGPAITKLLIDRFIDPTTAGQLPLAARLAGINRLSFLFLATIVGSFMLQYGQMYLMNLTGQRAMNDLRGELYEHLLELPMSYYDRSSVGWVMTRLTNDVEVLNEMFTSGVVAIFGDFFLLTGIVAFMFYLNATLAGVVMIVLPLLVAATMWFRVKARDAYAETRAKLGRMNAFLQENLMGIRVVQMFTREKRNYEHFKGLNGEYRDAFERTIFYYALFFPGVDFLSALALALLIWFGGGGILAGTMTFGTVYAFILYVERFYRPIRDLAEKYNIMQSAMASSERIFRLLDEEVTITDPPQPRFPEPMAGEVAFCNVWFGYESGPTDDDETSQRRGMRSVDVNESAPATEAGRAEAGSGEAPQREWVLKDVSFRVAPGQRVAIVGATGSGKTTIISLLTRLYDVQRGCIRVDGLDIREMDLARLRASVGVVLQDVFLFSGTIEGNLRLGEERISREQVEAAARHVNADPFIRRLPDGYGSRVEERGSTLSVGQRQLLAFARALAFDPTILVLDEATSSVDTETEALIQDALEKLMAGRTTIVIAHRLSTIQRADQIIVLHKGEVREVGSHAELLAAGGIYHRLYQLQYQAQERANGSAVAAAPSREA
jgi:ATP-binding cassette subfamily B multidrug efflux pump